MKPFAHNPRSFVMAVLAGTALFGAGSAFAQAAADRAPAVYPAAHLMPVDLHASIGWHGDRYWDGHRYWDHDEWMHRHPHAHDPHRFHDDRQPLPEHRY